MDSLEARAGLDAVCGLTWPEQYPLPLPLRVELWALVKDASPEEREGLVESFRDQHLKGDSAAPAARGGQEP